MPSSSNPPDEGGRFHADTIKTVASAVLAHLRQRKADPHFQADSELLIACAAAADLSDHHEALFHETSSMEDEKRREPVEHMLWTSVEPILLRLCDLHPATLEGHRARAAVFLAWDAGELASRAQTCGVLDRLVLAVIIDLLSHDPVPNLSP